VTFGNVLDAMIDGARNTLAVALVLTQFREVTFCAR
jgi:hypothetical protein